MKIDVNQSLINVDFFFFNVFPADLRISITLTLSSLDGLDFGRIFIFATVGWSEVSHSASVVSVLRERIPLAQ